jgi:hypothetical protein
MLDHSSLWHCFSNHAARASPAQVAFFSLGHEKKEHAGKWCEKPIIRFDLSEFRIIYSLNADLSTVVFSEESNIEEMSVVALKTKISR